MIRAIMVTVHIDLPIFSSPTEPFGYFLGSVELATMPRKDEAFPWPATWLEKFRGVFEDQTMQVWGEASAWPYPPPDAHFTLYGLVCRDRDQAHEIARHIGNCSGMAFEEHLCT